MKITNHATIEPYNKFSFVVVLPILIVFLAEFCSLKQRSTIIGMLMSIFFSSDTTDKILGSRRPFNYSESLQPLFKQARKAAAQRQGIPS